MQVIAINGKFPGAVLNATTNNNIVINVQNDLDESLLMTWYVLAKISYIYIIFIKPISDSVVSISCLFLGN